MRRKTWPRLAIMVLLVAILAITGCAGVDGIDGRNGLDVTGATGPAGPAGPAGADGSDGSDGEDGTDGASGETGAAGADGADGATGPAGPAGEDGRDGYSGAQGIPGVFPAFAVETQIKNSGMATAVFDTATVSAGSSRSFHLETTGVIGSGQEARIVLTPNQPMSLSDITSIAWQEYLVSGYMPHVDVILLRTDGVVDALVFEYAYNTSEGVTRPEGWPTYGASPGSWFATFADDGNGPAAVTDSSTAWLTTGAAGPPTWAVGTLANWKAGTATGANANLVNGDCIILRIEIEIDNWIPGGVQSEAYVDSIVVNGVAIPD